MLLDVSIARPKEPKEPKIKPGQLMVVRRFDGGFVEIKDHWGRLRRGWQVTCRQCPKLVFVAEVTHEASICSGCVAANQEKRRRDRQEDMERSAKKRYMELMELGLTSPQRRQTAFLLATPRWRDKAAIKAVYSEAKRKTKETGIAHHVDHIYPIQGGLSCGLHVHWNLQVMVGSENCSKSNSFPLDQSPAWGDCSPEEIGREFRQMRRDFEQAELTKGANQQ